MAKTCRSYAAEQYWAAEIELLEGRQAGTLESGRDEFLVESMAALRLQLTPVDIAEIEGRASPCKRTPDEILLFLIKNAVPDSYLPVSEDRPDDEYFDSEPYIRRVLLRLCGHTRYRVPLEAFEAFIGADYSFERYLRPLETSGALCFSVAVCGYYGTPHYRVLFDHTNGLIADYRSEKKRWIAFHLGRDPGVPGHAVTMYREVLKNLTGLGVKLPTRKNKSRMR